MTDPVGYTVNNGAAVTMNISLVETVIPGTVNKSYNGTAVDHYAIGATIISPITMCLAGLVGNILALIVLHRTKRKIRRMMFYTLVAALAWTDLTGIILTTPVTIAAYINRREMPGGVSLCRFNAFIMVCFGLSTPLIVCAMAVERFLALKCTYFYSKYCTTQNARITVLVLWAFVFVFGALPLFGFGEFTLQYPHTWCFLNFHTEELITAIYGYSYSILNLLIVILMMFCNGYVMVSLLRVRYIKRQQDKERSASICSSLMEGLDENKRLQAQIKKQKQRDVEMQMIWLMSAITTIFAVCWAPLMSHIIITLVTGKPNPVVGLLCIRLASLNQTLDPWLYILLRKTFIKRVHKTIKKICCSTSPPREQSECRCNQYVHVGRQLCHQKYYVGNSDPNDLPPEVSQQLRKLHATHSNSTSGTLPDVMRGTRSSKSQHTMPDVTKSPNNPSNETGDSSSRSPEGIYVDMYRVLPLVSVSDMNSGDMIDEDIHQDETSHMLLSSDAHCIEMAGESTSGVFSISPELSRSLLGSKDLHSDITPTIKVKNKANARRTKSYT
ncbi:hypothetical protein SNE40_012277 [Patella caerulea]|uniref:Prostaglandin E2 receptor EP4 subtype n=1 Tax=Patella caerulea TaxID=87958 RepID=A0AAN8JLI6_PATCE